jgi:plastocyanin
MWWSSRSRVRVAAPALILLAACSSGSAAPRTVGGDRVVYNPEPSTGPFTVVAVDDHFHDIHPVDRTRISGSRPFIVKNEGRNLHNFTVVGTHISVDIRPGHELAWAKLGAHLKPGFYRVICIYHYYLGMKGTFIVTK